MGIINYTSCETDDTENDKINNCNKHNQNSSKNCYWTQLISGISSE